MNLAHFHLATVHLPIVAIPLLALLLLAGIWLKKPDLNKAALLGIVLIALISIPIFFTGEAAEEVVEHLPSISEAQIENHEAAATIAFVMVILSGLVSLISVLTAKLRPSWAQYSLYATLLVAVVCSGTLIWAANEGGKIRHPEIFGTNAMPALPKGTGTILSG